MDLVYKCLGVCSRTTKWKTSLHLCFGHQKIAGCSRTRRVPKLLSCSQLDGGETSLSTTFAILEAHSEKKVLIHVGVTFATRTDFCFAKHRDCFPALGILISRIIQEKLCLALQKLRSKLLTSVNEKDAAGGATIRSIAGRTGASLSVIPYMENRASWISGAAPESNKQGWQYQLLP